MLDILEDLATRKAESLPNLGKVACGGGMDSYDEYWPSAMDNTSRGQEVKAAFARENIAFSTWNKNEDSRGFDV